MMLSRLLLLYSAVLLLPYHYVHAIPPPDLMAGIWQSTLSITSLFIAAAILCIASFKQHLLSLTRKTIFICLSVGLLLLVGGICIFSFWQFEKSKQAQITELHDIWRAFDEVYAAEAEIKTNAQLRAIPGVMSWQEFIQLSDNQPIVIDLRAPSAYALGHIPGSQNIRFTDLIRGGWYTLSGLEERPIYLLCYQGTSSSLATLFLQARGFSKIFRPPAGLLGDINDFPLPTFNTPYALTKSLHTSETISPLQSSAPASFVIDLSLQPAQHDNIAIDDHFVYPHSTIQEIAAKITVLPTSTAITLLCDSDVSCYSADVFTLDLWDSGRSVQAIIEL